MLIRTVSGDIDPASLGQLLYHEHLHCSMVPWKGDPEFEVVDVPVATAEVALAHDHGVDLIVDATTVDFGRDVLALRAISAGSGVPVVAGTGLYIDMTFPDWLDETSDEELADRFVREVTEGIDETGVRAGMIGEIGTSGEILPRERRVMQAAAEAHLRTGAPILTHTAEGVGALEQLDFYEAAGVDLERLVIGHVDCLADGAMHREIAERGAWVGFDRIGLTRYNSDESRAAHVVALLERGHEDRVVLSGDVGRKGRLASNGGEGYAGVQTRFLPRLRELGVSEEQLGKLMVENPKRLLAFVAEEGR